MLEKRSRARKTGELGGKKNSETSWGGLSGFKPAPEISRLHWPFFLLTPTFLEKEKMLVREEKETRMGGAGRGE